MGCCGCMGKNDGWGLAAGIGAAAAIVAGSMFGVADPGPDKGKAPPAPAAKEPKPSDAPKDSAASPYVLDFKMNRIDGKEEDLSAYKGKVVLMVNTASKCGYTPQYDGLQKLYSSKKDQGLVILGFPANDFGKQEPGANKDIAEFCSSKFSVQFPMFEKITVVGEKSHPLYKRLAGQPAPIGGEPKWNFTKFLVDRNGNVVARFEPKVKPDDAELNKKIDELLAAKAH